MKGENIGALIGMHTNFDYVICIVLGSNFDAIQLWFQFTGYSSLLIKTQELFYATLILINLGCSWKDRNKSIY